MKRKTKLIPALLLAVVVLCTQCKKSAHDSSLSNSDLKKAQQAALSPNCTECQESGTKVNSAEAAAWAAQIAPLMKFDRAAPDYPTTVEEVWGNTTPASRVCGGQLVYSNVNTTKSLNFPTYYDVQAHPNDANRIFIDYWWTYNRQQNCFSSLGGHDFDWEHIVVQMNKSTQRIISVTYFQHSGWYTKDWRNVPVNTKIPVYVGKIQHGSYHMARSLSLVGFECSYWGDYRNPRGPEDEAASGNNLVRMDCANQQFNFSGNWGTIGKGPLYRDRAYWNYGSCNGNDGAFGSVDGCSQCDFGSNVKIGSYTY